MEFLKDQYSNAEITFLLAHDRNKNVYYHIYSVIELLPNESSKTRALKLKRLNLKKNNDHTLYIEKRKIESIDEALALFRQSTDLKIDDDKIIFVNDEFPLEPPNSAPLILPSNSDSKNGLRAVLPTRISSMRLWTKVDSDRKTKTLFNEQEWIEVGQFTSDILGFDISRLDEHIGNIYLCAANPYYRSISFTLSDKAPGVYYNIKLRKGCNCQDIIMSISDKRGDLLSYIVEFHPVTPNGFISLIHEPQLFGIKIFDKNKNLIADEGSFTFIKQIEIEPLVKSSDFVIKIREGTTDKKLPPRPKYSNSGKIKVGDAGINLANYFKNARIAKQHLVNEENNEFIVYTSSDNPNEKDVIKQKAKDKIRELINKAKFKCIICDPYFGIKDLLEFVYHIQNISVEVRILSSKMFLSERINSPNIKDNSILLDEILEKIDNTTKSAEIRLDEIKIIIKENQLKKTDLPTNADLLYAGIVEYNSKPFQKIECRILKGSKSELHDRYLIIDNDVWALGSSLNEFGDRVSSIAKIESPFPVLKKVDEWWNNVLKTEKIEDYANKK